MKAIAFLLLPASLLVAVATSSATAHDADPYHDGWVAHVNDHQLEICYQDTPPTVGQTVQILRTSYVTVNKGPVRQQFRRSGAARIAASASSGCVSAELIDGSAERSDHARTMG
jgi:hypothetical protein